MIELVSVVLTVLVCFVLLLIRGAMRGKFDRKSRADIKKR